MRLLLDAHVLLWWLADDPTLSQAARAAIAAPSSEVFVSAATVWEIGIKHSLGKLALPGDLLEAIAAEAFQSLPVSLPHAWLAASLPRHHDDPFDRMLVAQATHEGLTLVTRDERLPRYGLPLLTA